MNCQPPMSTKAGTDRAWGAGLRASDKSPMGKRACVCLPAGILLSHLPQLLLGPSYHYLSIPVGQEGGESGVEFGGWGCRLSPP